MAKVTVYGQIPFTFEIDIDNNFLKLDKKQGKYFKEFVGNDCLVKVFEQTYNKLYELNSQNNLIEDIQIEAIQDNQTGSWLYDV